MDEALTPQAMRQAAPEIIQRPVDLGNVVHGHACYVHLALTRSPERKLRRPVAAERCAARLDIVRSWVWPGSDPAIAPRGRKRAIFSGITFYNSTSCFMKCGNGLEREMYTPTAGISRSATTIVRGSNCSWRHRMKAPDRSAQSGFLCADATVTMRHGQSRAIGKSREEFAELSDVRDDVVDDGDVAPRAQLVDQHRRGGAASGNGVRHETALFAQDLHEEIINERHRPRPVAFGR